MPDSEELELEFSEKSEFPSCECDFDVDVSTGRPVITGNPDMTCSLQRASFLLPVSSNKKNQF